MYVGVDRAGRGAGQEDGRDLSARIVPRRIAEAGPPSGMAGPVAPDRPDPQDAATAEERGPRWQAEAATAEKTAASRAQDRLQCVVVTPERTLFDETVDFVALPLYDGELGVLPGRTPADRPARLRRAAHPDWARRSTATSSTAASPRSATTWSPS